MTDGKRWECGKFRDAMITLGVTGDSLFARIRDDLERGLVTEARAHLNFVDAMIKEDTFTETITELEQRRVR